jgi:hypothetical protein
MTPQIVKNNLIEKLKITVINTENLFILFDENTHQIPHFREELLKTIQDGSLTELEWQKRSTSIYDNKSLHQTKKLAQALLEIDADFYLMCEVGGLESLTNFNDLFLNNQYTPYLIEGNSDRHIDIGYLVKKDFPFQCEIKSHKERSINFLYPHEKDTQVPSHKFSRDVSELRVVNPKNSELLMIFLLVHLKSPLDRDGIDSGGCLRREAELKTLVEIYNELQQVHDVPIAIGGDFNGNASILNTDNEFKDLYEKTFLKDALEIAAIPLYERATFYHVRNHQRTDGRQIDFCFLNQVLWSKLEADETFVYRYKNAFGHRPLGPSSIEEKLNGPSDHYPVVITIKAPF